MKQPILLIEDDPDITGSMGVVLEWERYQLTTASTRMEALTAFRTTPFDLILLDLRLPDIDGIDLLRILRKRIYLSIIIISAGNNEEEKAKALDLGADDYVTKSFGTNELFARIRTALHHQNVQTESLTVVENKDLKIDFERQLVYRKRQEIHLMKNEYRILALMFRQLEKVVAYQTLMAKVRGPYNNDSQTLRVDMSNTRKKIENDILKPGYLITEIGVGYHLRGHRLK